MRTPILLRIPLLGTMPVNRKQKKQTKQTKQKKQRNRGKEKLTIDESTDNLLNKKHRNHRLPNFSILSVLGAQF
jgi:hypothetical protein